MITVRALSFVDSTVRHRATRPEIGKGASWTSSKSLISFIDPLLSETNNPFSERCYNVVILAWLGEKMWTIY